MLLLRLERIGDLLMTLEAIATVRARLPHARLDLVIGSWNRALAGMIPFVDRVETLDLPWIARDADGWSRTELYRRARAWRRERYDIAVNFESDIRSNLLLALSGAPVRAGFESAGGGSLLTCALSYDTSAHTSTNALRLVTEAFRETRPENVAPIPRPLLAVPDSARSAVTTLLGSSEPGGANPLVGIHVSGGRQIKQWEPRRFGELATKLACDIGARLVFTGTEADRSLVNAAREAMPSTLPVVDLVGQLDLVGLAALCERLNLLVTGDTGPMHLAAALGTPTVAIFGPSDPRRYAPTDPRHRIVRVDLTCSPCNRIRLPPARCRGHVPDCLEAVTVDAVHRAAGDVLNERAPRGSGRASV